VNAGIAGVGNGDGDGMAAGEPKGDGAGLAANAGDGDRVAAGVAPAESGFGRV
jgi:hypothetical protein